MSASPPPTSAKTQNVLLSSTLANSTPLPPKLPSALSPHHQKLPTSTHSWCRTKVKALKLWRHVPHPKLDPNPNPNRAPKKSPKTRRSSG